MEIQFLGHAALYIKTSTHNILVDPFISGNPKGKLNKYSRFKSACYFINSCS